MRIFSAVFLADRAVQGLKKGGKPTATCDISHLFEGDETIYNVKCENFIGNNYSENRRVLRLFTDQKNEPETIRCIVSCKYDLEQKQKIVLRAALNEENKCVVVTPKKLDGLCGKGCSSKPVRDKMGSTMSRHSCKQNTFDEIVQPGDSCAFSCQTDEGEFLTTEEELKCSCFDDKEGRKCDWRVGETNQPITATDQNGQYLVPTIMDTRGDMQSCSTAKECAEDEYLAMTHPDYLYGNMLDYYMADPEEYGFNIGCIKRACSKIELDDIVCFKPSGEEIEINETFPEGTRCARRCGKAGYGYDHTPTDKYVGKESSTTGGHGKYNFIPASDVVCTCGHQYSWPRETHDYYGQFYPDEYYGNFCEWNYGKGPLEEYKPVLKKALQEQPEQLGEGVQAAQYLAECKPNYCKADMINDKEVKNYIMNNLIGLYGLSDYGSETENGHQYVEYTVDGVLYQYGLEELWQFREIFCPDSARIPGESGKVKKGTKCLLTCKEGFDWLPNDERSDTVECVGEWGIFGTGGWSWMPTDWQIDYSSPRLNLRICVPNNYADRDRENNRELL